MIREVILSTDQLMTAVAEWCGKHNPFELPPDTPDNITCTIQFMIIQRQPMAKVTLDK